MSADEEAQSVKPHSQATNEGVDIELSEEAVASLASYFDLLIQMDLESKGNEGAKDDSRREVHGRNKESDGKLSR